ncbi:unnamed protein product, partial [Discosporangium mesarthrocarpum]
EPPDCVERGGRGDGDRSAVVRMADMAETLFVGVVGHGAYNHKVAGLGQHGKALAPNLTAINLPPLGSGLEGEEGDLL